MCGILFWNGSLNRELVSFFAFLDGLRFKGDFVGYEQRYSWSPVLSIGMKYLFASPPFQSIRVLALGWASLGSRLKVFALVHNLAFCVFWWEHSVPEQFRWALIDVSWLPFEALFSRWFYVSLFSFLFLWVDGFHWFSAGVLSFSDFCMQCWLLDWGCPVLLLC